MPEFDPAATTALAPHTPVTAPVPARPVANNTYVTGFDDESVRKYDFDLFSGRVGQIDRIYLVRSKELVKVRQHYSDVTGFGYVRCNSTYAQQGNQEILTKEAACCKHLGRSSLRFGALILRYATDKNGNLLRPFQPPELRLWKFSTDKYLTLKQINNDFSLETHDLSVTCTEEKFQKLTLGAKPECIYLLANFPVELKTQIETWAAASMLKLPSEMAKVMTDDEILKTLGQAGAAAPVMTPADQPIINFDEIVGAPKAP